MNEVKKIKRSLLITNLIILILFICSIDNINVYSAKPNESYKVLVINSYSVQSEWEKFVREGFIKEIKSKNDININLDFEFLETDKVNDKEYLAKYQELLEKKYKNNEIDAIVTIDDDAFNLMRKAIFNEDSNFYHKPIVFIGVNQIVQLTNEEREYITGLLDIENNLESINLILNLHEQVDAINVILNESIYSDTFKANIQSTKPFLKRQVEINFIQNKYIEDIVAEIKDKDGPNQINFVVGAWVNKDKDEYVNSKETIKLIDSVTNNPIYVGRQPYVDKGVVGGFIDNGQKYGELAAEVLINILKEDVSIKDIPDIKEPVGQYVFDYDKIYEYKIDPLKIPKDSIILNKGKYELLIPKELKFMIGLGVITFLGIIIVVIYLHLMEGKKHKESKKLYEKAKEREVLKTDFIVNMSHELRTPLNVILSTARLLEIKASDDSEEIEKTYLIQRLDSIKQNSNRLLRLVNNLIDVTKFEVGVYEVNFENLNIVEVVENTIEVASDFAKNKNIDVIFDTEEEEIIIAIDREKIERVILNLFSNAIKFTNPGGKIDIFIKNNKDKVFIEIEDNGIGIPKEKINEVFQRFYQVDNTLVRENEGSGIGLCIVQELVHMHNGNIYVESEFAKGTKFTIELPKSTIDQEKETHKISSMDLKELARLEMSDVNK